jgi:alpha-maltose-1-phosphate synthase
VTGDTALRVGIVTREYPPEVYGGAGVHVEHLARALADRVEVAVHCFGGPRDDHLVAGNYEPWEALTGDAPHMAALRTLSVDLAIAADVGTSDLVHSHTWYANLAGHLAKLLYDVPHVMTTHSLEPLRPWKREQLRGGYEVSRFCERTAIDAADAVIAVSSGMRDDVLTAYPGVDPARVHVVHNGIDAEVYRPDPSTDVLEARGVDPARPTVVFVGRITRQKGLPHLLRAARDLRGDAQIVLCAGEPDTSEIAAEVRDLVDGLHGERDGVIWIEEMLTRPEVVQILSHATVFVCPSVYEPFGLVNLEAMACEAPVVATATGGIPEIVVEGETGSLVAYDPDEPEAFASALAQAINRLLDDPAAAERFGKAGRRRVLDHFTWEAVAARTADIYRLVLG